jgi:hypothetical protein
MKYRHIVKIAVATILASSGVATAEEPTTAQVDEVSTTLKHLAVATAEDPTPAQVDKVPTTLKQDADCMYKVLRKTPGITEAKLGYVTRNGWTTPFLEYRADEGASRDIPIRFDAMKSDNGGYWFLAYRSGLGGLPDLHVTDAVMKIWKTQCRVDANVLLP